MPALLTKPRLGRVQIDPYPYQLEAVEAVRNEFRKGIKRTMIHLFTGAGKTIIAAMCARAAVEKGNRVLMTCHTEPLVYQSAEKMDYLGVDVGIEKAQSRARVLWEPDVVVASIQTLSPARLAEWPRDYFDLIIPDETHHALAPSWRRVFAHFSTARVMGLTATIKRGDGEDLGQFFESIAFTRNLPFAWNAPPPGPYASDIMPIKRDLGINLRDLKKKAADFTDAELEARITPHIEMLANLTKIESGERSGLIFTPQVKSAQGMATALQKLGCRAEWTSGEDQHFKDKIDRYQSGELQFLASCAKLAEGFDAPRTSSISYYRPTKSRNLQNQIIGRGVRLYPGKENCILIDPGYLVDDDKLIEISELCDSPDMDSEVLGIISNLLKKDDKLTLAVACEKAKAVHKEQQILRIQAKEREIRARRVSYSLRDVYNTLGVPWRGPSNPVTTSNPATEWQMSFLTRRGVQDLDGMSKTRASTLVGVIKEREKLGLASMREVSRLIAWGVEPAVAQAMSGRDAFAMIGELGKKYRGYR